MFSFLFIKVSDLFAKFSSIAFGPPLLGRKCLYIFSRRDNFHLSSSFKLLGLILILPMQQFKYFFRCDWKTLKSYSDSIINCIDDGGCRGQLGSFPRLFGAEWAFRIVCLDLYRIDRWDFHGGWNAVI